LAFLASCSLPEFETNHAVPTQAIVRPSGDHPEPIRTGKLAVNLDSRVLTVDDQPIHLTGKEYAILELLSLRKDTVVTKEMFLNHLYRGVDEPEIKIIDVFICKLRKKLAQATGGNHYIETIWGRGWLLRDPAVWAPTQRQRDDAPSDNPSGLSSAHGETISLARQAALAAIQRLIELISSEDERVASVACNAVLDCAFGRLREWELKAEEAQPQAELDPRAYNAAKLDTIERGLRLMLQKLPRLQVPHPKVISSRAR
jgi:DNA-binding winged helix-turn-helix (wHTH) protein